MLHAARGTDRPQRSGRRITHPTRWLSRVCPSARHIASALLLASATSLGAQTDAALPRAEANDHGTAAGRLVDGVLTIELEAVEAAWYPRGPDGPRIVTPAFAEVGGPPMVPGPLVRARAGTPVQVRVHNRLDRAITVRGLVDRTAAEPVRGLPAFAFADSLVIPPGESRETHFLPTRDVSSFYYGRSAVAPETPIPAGPGLEEGIFMGALVVDADGSPPHPDERVFLITRWGSPADPTTTSPSFKMMINGQSWPFTDRVRLTVGDTAHWRIINASMVDHPMHLHGFFYTVDAAGDMQADTVYAPDARRQAVTELMPRLSSLRVRWVPEEPGNWLFHCHLVRHMGEVQMFSEERSASADGEHMGMAGLIIGISVLPRPGFAETDPPPARRIDLWTGTRPGVYDGAPEHAFIIQAGDVPPPDSTRVPGSPIVLTRGEPTEIIVHNRLDFPLSVHWHGLELRSAYDGVGDWSGMPDRPRPPIQPGESRRVVIEPVRAGTFFYHTHGEPRHELTQGLYGAFLVLEPGEARDPASDRIFVLGARGATRDAPPAVNGLVEPAVEPFEPGGTYRLRFAHISADAYKRIRLLRDGAAVQWTPWAKDGADLPAARRQAGTAEIGLGVGEAFDARWTPEAPGVYVLEIVTEYYPERGGRSIQRVPFAVGAVTEADVRIAVTGTDLPIVELTPDERERYVGIFQGLRVDDGSADDWTFGIWDTGDGLRAVTSQPGLATTVETFLIPLGDHTFTTGDIIDGMITADAGRRVVFAGAGERSEGLEIVQDGSITFRLRRTDRFELPPEALRPFAGTYRATTDPLDVMFDVRDGTLMMSVANVESVALEPISPVHFRPAPGAPIPPDVVVRFDPDGGAVVLTSADFSLRAARVEAAERR